jgi:predicted outer membrane protein
MIRPRRLWFLLATASLAGALACDRPNGGTGVTSQQGSNAPQESTQPSGQPTAQAPAPSSTGQPSGSGTMATNATQTTVDVSNLDDAGLAGVLQSLHQRIVEIAQLGESDAKSRDVKQLAHDLDSHHTDTITGDQKLFQRVSIVPKQTPASQQIDADRVASIKTLRGAKPGEFDRRFLDVQGHAVSESLLVLDHMAGIARNADLKAELTNQKPQFSDDAKAIGRAQQGISRGVTAPQPSSGRGERK